MSQDHCICLYCAFFFSRDSSLNLDFILFFLNVFKNQKKKNHQIYISIDFKLDFYWMICNFPLKNVQYKKGIFFLLKIANEWYEFHYQYEVMKMEEKKISQNRNITYSDCVTWTFAITHLHFTHVKCNLQIFYFVNSCLVWIGSTITWKFSKNIMTKYLKPTNTPCLYVW